MLTRRAKRVHGLRDAREAALSLPLLGPLPGDLVKLILLLLPLDGRLCAREVRRGWCALLEDASFWTHVDLSASCGVNPRFLDGERLGLALLRAACVRAKGNLQSVDLSGVSNLVMQWLEYASMADKASLRDLVAPPYLHLAHVTALCRTLTLCRVRCGVECTAEQALPLLRRKAPFDLLTIVKLCVGPGTAEESVLALASALSGYKGMEKLTIFHVLPLATRAVVDALVDAAISAGIEDMRFEECGLAPTALPALGRLLQSPVVKKLEVTTLQGVMFEGPHLPAFCEALRSSKSLKTLTLFLDAMGEAGMAPIFEALRNNNTLAELSLCGERIGAEFARDVVLPAVRANTGLRTLCLGSARAFWPYEIIEMEELLPALQEVKDILAARVLADKEAS